MPFDGKLCTKPSVADALRRAKALIDSPEKWKQFGGSSIMPSGKNGHCVMSAMNVVAPSTLCKPHPFFDAGRVLLERATGSGVVWQWNDEPGRTHAEVMEAFDKAMALAEQSEGGS